MSSVVGPGMISKSAKLRSRKAAIIVIIPPIVITPLPEDTSSRWSTSQAPKFNLSSPSLKCQRKSNSRLETTPELSPLAKIVLAIRRWDSLKAGCTMAVALSVLGSLVNRPVIFLQKDPGLCFREGLSLGPNLPSVGHPNAWFTCSMVIL